MTRASSPTLLLQAARRAIDARLELLAAAAFAEVEVGEPGERYAAVADLVDMQRARPSGQWVNACAPNAQLRLARLARPRGCGRARPAAQHAAVDTQLGAFKRPACAAADGQLIEQS
jgi:hypothetical protein